MNYLVFLDPYAGELEKILSGTKSMLLKEFDPAGASCIQVAPGDNLYFLRNNAGCDLRVRATVTRVLFLTNQSGEDLSRVLKEMQTGLQLTEDQFNSWSARKQSLLVEFSSARKIDAIRVFTQKIPDRPGWIAFEDFSLITE